MLNNDLNDFKNIQKEIKFLTNSNNRLEILHCLLKSPQTLKEIHEKTGLNNSSISINVSSLESKGYVVNRNDIYSLTNSSKIILTNIFYFNKSANFLDKNADFLNSHKLNNLHCNNATKANQYANLLGPILNNIGHLQYAFVGFVG